MQTPSLCKERAIFEQGHAFIAGVDEAGRGAWAGPVVAAAAILPVHDSDLLDKLDGVRDSKQIVPQQRDELFDKIRLTALSLGIGIVPSAFIDRHRIIAATCRAMQQAIAQLYPVPTYLLIDALPLPGLKIAQQAYPKADATSLSVAAASIVAKVTRDRLMLEFDQRYPGYAFGRHKGYGTKAHRAALDELGPCPIHRYSFGPIQAIGKPKYTGN